MFGSMKSSGGQGFSGIIPANNTPDPRRLDAQTMRAMRILPLRSVPAPTSGAEFIG